MPTIPKVVAALFFAALGYFCGDLVKPLLPEGTPTPWLNETLAAIGALCGWAMPGKRAGGGMRAGFGYGLTAAALLVFWGIFVFAGYEALDMSLNRRFDGPIQAIKGMVKIAIEYGRMIATPDIIGALIVGGLFGGWLSEWTARRWN